MADEDKKVVTLPGVKRQMDTNAQINEQAIKGLERALELARKGAVTGLGMAVAVEGQEVMTFYTLSRNCHELISGTALLHHRVCQEHRKG